MHGAKYFWKDNKIALFQWPEAGGGIINRSKFNARVIEKRNISSGGAGWSPQFCSATADFVCACEAGVGLGRGINSSNMRNSYKSLYLLEANKFSFIKSTDLFHNYSV